MMTVLQILFGVLLLLSMVATMAVLWPAPPEPVPPGSVRPGSVPSDSGAAAEKERARYPRYLPDPDERTRRC